MIKRRRLLLTLAALPGTRAVAASDNGGDLEDPYAGIDWEQCEFVHSMSHQHQGQTEASLDGFREMGYRHLAFSNYYPSAPTFPLPASYLEKHPDLIGAPNAEQHSFPDAPLHFNSLGSLLATGYGASVGGARLKNSPIIHRFENLNIFDPARPWEGVYRLDLRLAATDPAPPASLTVTGATECAFRDQFADLGPVRDRLFTPGNHVIHLRATAPTLEVALTFDPARQEITQFRLMQGANRPWRDVFRAALDSLLHADGGGITLNHPTGKVEDYTAMLDYDPRVLGIEVWNQLTSGFGSNRGFYDSSTGPHLHFYRLWDDILRTGRRCWGFFVKDHNTFGRGRNILVTPPLAPLSPAEREAAALRAYRRGSFFGSVAAIAANDAGETVAPFDRSDFRFSRLTVKKDPDGRPAALLAAVAGNDAVKRPRLQIRFITDQGIAAVVDGPEAEFPLPRDARGRLVPAFVRVEAIAYPDTHLLGQPLTPEAVGTMNVHEISRLHDRMAVRGPRFFGTPAELRAPIPIADMIFSQPFRRI